MTSEGFRTLGPRGAVMAIVAAALLVVGGVRPTAQGRAPDRAVQQLLVKYKPGATNAHRQAALARAGARLRARFANLDIDHLDLPGNVDADRALLTLQSDPAVLYAQPNYVRRMVAGAPNDPAWLNSSLWGLARINAPAAWSSFPNGAHDIVIAVLDTGINYGHPDLAASVWTNPGEVAGNGLDDDHNGYVDDVHGIDRANGDADPMDDNGHGTHAAGTIGAQGNNGVGGVGVAWNPQLLACKFLDAAGNGYDSSAIACFDYVIDLKLRHGINIRITNNSWGSLRDQAGPFPQALKDAVDAAGQAGIVNVFAAGNSGVNVESNPFDPASFTSPSIVSVAASDEADARASFSNYGAASVDLAAPGVNILSTYGDSYSYSSGTSMAAPHVSGTLALMAAQNPGATATDLKTRLLASVDAVPAWAGFTVTGGRLNVFQALVASTESSAPSALAAAGWSHGDVGATGANGDATLSNGAFQVTGAGADVWGGADAFHYVYRTLDGDGSIVARVSAIQNVNNWTKAGVMIRNSLSASAAQGFMLVAASPVKGVPFQRRLVDGGGSVSTPGSPSTAPRWVKLVRSGSVLSAYESADGVLWTLVGSDTFAFGQTVLVGLAVSSHVAGTNATATFDNVTVSTPAPTSAAPAAGDLPNGWSQGDIGSVPFAGEGRTNGGVFTVKGSGADVWGTTDAFHYVYTTVSGDSTIVARVTGVQQDVNVWVKAGVMIRESLSAGSAHAFMIVSAGKGLAFQRRAIANDVSVNSAGAFTGAPRWVKLQRNGNLFSAYESPDGVAWTLVGNETIAMGQTVYVGLAVTSHVTGASATCTFDQVTVR
jgi:subtilisin family serine protease